jgi:hypothetical protein
MCAPSTLPHWLSICSHPRKIAASIQMIRTKEEIPWGIIQPGIAVATGFASGEVHDGRPVALGQDARAGRF